MKQNIGMAAVITGILGAGFGVGGVENSVSTRDLVASIGVAVTGLMLLYAGVQLVKDAE
jgi:hypothetical protein